MNTVKLGDKERFDKEQIGVKELFTDYQPFCAISLLLHKKLLPIQKMPKLGISDCKNQQKVQGIKKIEMYNIYVIKLQTASVPEFKPHSHSHLIPHMCGCS